MIVRKKNDMEKMALKFSIYNKLETKYMVNLHCKY